MGGITQRAVRTGSGWLFILQTGLVTTALALLAVHVLARRSDDWAVMGWFYFHIVPVGAIGVGLVAGTGYLIGALWVRRRISRLLAVLVGLLQVGAYFAAEYLEYRQLHIFDLATGKPLGFWPWYDFVTVNMTFSRPGELDQPIGQLGYAVRFVQVAGFAGAGLLLAWLAVAMISDDACKLCGRMKERKELGVLPASGPQEPLVPVDENDEEGKEMAQVWLGPVTELVEANAVESVTDVLRDARAHAAEIESLPRRVRLHVEWCPDCGWSFLQSTLLRRTEGGYVELDPLEATALTADMREALRRA